MVKLNIDSSDPTPIYAQLERAIMVEVASGRLPAGSQLPTVRQLAVDLKVNANTVAKVYATLERAGVVETRRGVGTFIVEVPQQGTRRDMERELRLLSDRYIASASALGYSLDEIIRHLRNRF